ncbi:MAG: DUF4278 domain-containing protein [Cyanobacteria bacterium J06638_28]
MELKYRGTTYQASTLGEQSTLIEQVSVRRGAALPMKSVKNSLHRPGNELIYRGVRYTR